MPDGPGQSTISILCVDDNPRVAAALRMKLQRVGGFAWVGWLPTADDLVARATAECPDVVLLDLDMPGLDPLEALAAMVDTCPDTRVVVYSGYIRRDLIERVIDTGAWGYVSKNDGEQALIDVVRRVAADGFALSPEVHSIWST